MQKKPISRCESGVSRNPTPGFIFNTIKKYIEDHKNEMYSAIGEDKAERLFEYINNNFIEDIQAYLI